MRIDPEDYAFVAQFSPLSTAKAVAGLQQQVKSRLLSLVFSLLIIVVLWFVYGRPTSGFGAAVLVAMLCIPVGLIIATLVRKSLLKSRLTGINAGPAIRIDPLGLVVADAAGPQRLPWSQVQSIATKPHVFAPGPELVVKRAGQRDWRVPFSYLDVMPGTIDSAIRAHTGGHRSLDTRATSRII
jgi:hypothetical protein